MIIGEIANFAAYAFAPAILVTPLGALSIIFRYYQYQCIYINISHCSEIDTMYKYYFLLISKFFIMQCSSILAHFILKEKLHIFGMLGCVLCVVGSTTMVLHSPRERDIESVKQVWHLATKPGN